MEKNLRKINPNLEVGDRVILVHMDGDHNLLLGEQKGIVKRVAKTPKFIRSDVGYQYDMEWLDDDGKVVSKLALMPEYDVWIFDKDYYKNLK